MKILIQQDQEVILQMQAKLELALNNQVVIHEGLSNMMSSHLERLKGGCMRRPKQRTIRTK